MARLLARHRARGCRDAPPGLRPATDPVRRAWVARSAHLELCSGVAQQAARPTSGSLAPGKGTQMIVLLAPAAAAVVFGQIDQRRIFTFVGSSNLESVGTGDLALGPVTASHQHEGEQSERQLFADGAHQDASSPRLRRAGLELFRAGGYAGQSACARRSGTGWERTPWHATQRAAWEAMKRSQRRCLNLVPRRRAS